MKQKISLLFLLLLVAGWSKGQFALEKTYDFSLTVTKINATEYKYFLMDVAKSECRIYHLDHTLWKTIPIALPADYYLGDIKFVTQDLFDSDSDIELWYTAYNWVVVGTGGYYRYLSKVIDEKGMEVANIPNGLYAYIMKTGETQYKMTAYGYDNSFFPGAVKTYVYAMPGTNTAVYHAVAKLDDPWPNPASGAINLPLLAGEVSGTLRVYSVTGQLMLEEQLSGQPVFRLETSGWAPGAYIYRVTGGSPDSIGVSGTRKFLVR